MRACILKLESLVLLKRSKMSQLGTLSLTRKLERRTFDYRWKFMLSQKIQAMPLVGPWPMVTYNLWIFQMLLSFVMNVLDEPDFS